MRGGRPPGYDGYELHLDAAALGVRTIHDAVRLAAGLIGPGPVRYDLPSRADLVDAARLGGHDLPTAAAIARAGQPPGEAADPADRLAAAEARLADATARLARAEADLRREREARAAAERRATVAERCAGAAARPAAARPQGGRAGQGERRGVNPLPPSCPARTESGLHRIGNL